MHTILPMRGFVHLLAIAGLLTAVPAAVALEVDGFTEPYRDIDVAASEAGLLERIEVKEGDRVTAGQLLARLDDTVLQATLAIAKTAVESQGRLESAEAELKLQSEMVAKLHGLRQRGHASRQEIERAESQLQIARANVRAMREQHRIKSLEYRRTRAQLKQRRLTSPIDGIVTHIHKDRGEFVSLSDPVVLKVVQLDPLLVVFSVPAKLGRALSAGQSADVRIAESTVQGEVEFVSPSTDPQSGTTRVRVRIPNAGERLPSGAPCRLLLTDPSVPQANVTER